ncbi:hypothetical protein HHI36_011103 [Cryptolaemus montrouzieri]|uniref:protein-serine/threonine phosphatase n=1 Tax=Cryptolaemus montrouzieri TaxID=559131 RepID=A0ABD2MKS0_9CUCU
MMGQTLSEPITKKETASWGNSAYKVAASCMQGWRVSMEDSHTVILSLPDDPDASFFGVFDGHGGGKIAKYASTHLHKYITNRKEYKEGDIAEALRQGFLELDAAMAEDEELNKEYSGTTAVTVLIKDNQVYCANIGDSRAVACFDRGVKRLSEDHKPNQPVERARIEAAGGWVESARVNGSLALSRAFGDFIFKKKSDKKPEEQIVTAFPDVTVHTLSPEWDFIVLACDGIWDVMANSEVVGYIQRQIARRLELETICENMMMKCLGPDLQMGFGCDNMTVVIVAFLQGGSYWDLTVKCQQYQEGSSPERTPGWEQDEFNKSNSIEHTSCDESDEEPHSI